ncbi:MarR family winged helix-turn-helix transcriptional regulator [Streptomyces subrutilus]|uniref:MarR family winged helix-turn-helix transcriptional regulator n=1 Tax=Streptomyces subrutilus TaxID=36818 RepID=UPI0033C9BE71
MADSVPALVDLWAAAADSAPPRLSNLQWRALMAAQRSPGINLTRLAEEVGAGAPATSRLCDRLEAAGLLRRCRTEANRREVGLTLTRQGRETVDRLHERRTEALQEILGLMTTGDRQSLLDGLQAFARAAKEQPPAE